MTIEEAIRQVDTLTVNQIGREEKIRWLSDLDSTIYIDIYNTHEELNKVPEPGIAGEDSVLLVKAPHDVLYRWYLEMHIHDANGEMARYNNAAEKFNAALVNYMDYVNRTYLPVSHGPLRLI